MSGRHGTHMQMSIPLTKMVKYLLIANVSIWFLFVLVGRGALGFESLFEYFGLVPYRIINDFFIWQPLTYMFLHSTNLFHILFNMFILYWAGAEIEQQWGAKIFYAIILPPVWERPFSILLV